MKLLIMIVLMVMSYKLGSLGLSGREARSSLEAIGKHRKHANSALILVISLVGIIEIMTRSGLIGERGTLFVVHLFLAIPALTTLLVLRFWLTGIHAKRVHRPLAYACLGLFAGTVITGGWLLL